MTPIVLTQGSLGMIEKAYGPKLTATRRLALKAVFALGVSISAFIALYAVASTFAG